MSEAAQRTPAVPGVLAPVAGLTRAPAEPVPQPATGAGTPHGLELRHLRYFVALADAGTFTRAADPRFGFIDPPFRCSLPVTLAFAATGNRTAAVLTGPVTTGGRRAGPVRRSGPADASDMVRVSLQHHPLTAMAALVWNADLPRPLQQMLFETADSLTAAVPSRPAELVSLTTA